MTAFDQAFAALIGEEGAFTCNPQDPGNWTGGACGSGVCRGTKYGISAAAFPDLDIASLSLDQARTIYHDLYWTTVGGDHLPLALALLVFDAAANCGAKRSASWLQTAAGCAVDGVIGPATLAAVEARKTDIAGLCAEVLARRMAWMASLPSWHQFGLGWARRLCRLPYLSTTMGDAR